MIWYFYKKSFDCHQELAVDHHEVIVRRSSSSVLSQQNLKKLYLGILRHKEKIIIGTKQFVSEEILLFLDMMHPIVPGANDKLQRYCKTYYIGNIVSKTGAILHFIVTLTHSVSHFRDIVASPPKGHSSHKKGKIFAQPHTVVKNFRTLHCLSIRFRCYAYMFRVVQ